MFSVVFTNTFFEMLSIGEQEKNLIMTGLSMGLIHVLAGPDHLSALAALAVGTSYKSFMLGVRWGIGHSTGLIVVAVVFIALKGDLDLRRLGRYCDSLVGVFMLSLGCYGVISAVRSYREKRQKRDHDEDKTQISIPVNTPKSPFLHISASYDKYGQSTLSEPTILSANITNSSVGLIHHVNHTSHSISLLRRSASASGIHLAGDSDLESNQAAFSSTSLIAAVSPRHSINLDVLANNVEEVDEDSDDRAPLLSLLEKPIDTSLSMTSKSSFHNDKDMKRSWWTVVCEMIAFLSNAHHHSAMETDTQYSVDECELCPFINMHDPATQRILSFVIGLLHGVAGPGGILGVLPAVEMQKWTSSILYLSSFIFASTFSMGTFAALYGEITRRLGATTEVVELGLSVFSSGMSIVVGVIWFVFSMLGRLDEFFH